MLNDITNQKLVIDSSLPTSSITSNKKSCSQKKTRNKNILFKKSKFNSKFRLTRNNNKIEFSLIGQQARTLKALIECKNQGITSLSISSWALRLSAYIHILRTKHFLNISTISEPHEGGMHGRYFLHDDISIINEEK